MARIIKLNDFDEVKRIEQKLSQNVNYDLGIMAKYYKSLGYGPARTKRLLRELLVKNSVNYIAYSDGITAAINAAKRYKLREKGQGVVITKKELDRLRNIDVDDAKVLFFMLAVARYEKFNNIRLGNKKEVIGYFCWHTFEDVLKSVGLKKNKKEINEIKYRLDGKLGLISATLISESNWRICFADDNSEPAIHIEDIERIMEYFPYFCDKCGIKLDKKPKRIKLCDNCKREKRKEDIRENVRRHRLRVIN